MLRSLQRRRLNDVRFPGVAGHYLALEPFTGLLDDKACGAMGGDEQTSGFVFLAGVVWR